MTRTLSVLCLLALVAACEPAEVVDDAAAVDGATGVDAGNPDAWALDSATGADGSGPDSAQPPTDASTAADATLTDRASGADGAGVPDGATPVDAGGGDAGSTGVELNDGWIGGACANAGGCDLADFSATAVCETQGFPGGFCTQACSESTVVTGRWVCPDATSTGYGGSTGYTTTRCITTDDGSPTCVAECDFGQSPSGCRPGYACVLRQRHNEPASIFAVCLPADTQTWPGASAPVNDIGEACAGDGDCGHLACMSGPGGYCVKTMCEFTGCPQGSRCFELASSTVCANDGTARCTACLKDCTVDGNCRQSEGYACDDDDVCWPQPTGECQPIDTNAPTNPFNHFVLEAVNDATLFPRDGTYPFCLGGGSCGPYGFLHDGIYQAQTVFQGAGDCMCTGHTLEIFLDAWRRYRAANSLADSAQMGGLTLAQLNLGAFYKQWQGTGDAQHANLASAGYAFEIASAGIHIGNDSSSLETVQPGDFVNLSRDPPSGHSVVFIGWIRNSSNAIIGLRYFGCNPASWEPEQCASASDPANTVVAGAPSFMSEYFYDVVGSGGVIRSGIYGLQIGRAVP